MAQRNIDTTRNRILNVVSFPSKDFPADVYAAIGQFMGVLWIIIGLFLAKAQYWLSNSLMGIVAESLVVFLPFMVSGALIKMLLFNKTRS